MALREDHDYRRLFDQAINARDDGDREDAAVLFKEMLARFPGDVTVLSEYVRTLISLKDFGAADAALHNALEREPNNHVIREIWATLPFQGCNWDDQIARDKVFRSGLPAAQGHLGKQSIIYTLAALWESGRWPEAAAFIRANRATFLADPDVFGMGVQILGLIGGLAEIRALLADAAPAAWSRLPPEARDSVTRRLDEAERNRALVIANDVKIISLGQHCLPYQLGVRWGFSAAPVEATSMTPFDLGAFGGNTAADAIENDFADFAPRENFAVVPNWGGGTMYRHVAGVHFHHERGPFFMENEGANFFARLHRMLGNWRAAANSGRRLFIFCLVGDGDIARLIEVTGHLLTRGARLLVINVLKEPRDVPRHPRVTYLHAPYPDDYFWVELHNHGSHRGFAFEATIAHAIRDQIVRIAAEPDLSDDAYVAYRQLLDRAVEAREDGEPEDSAALLTQMLRLHPGDVDATLEYVRTCRSLGQPNDAEPYLSTTIAKHPDNFELCKAWVDLPAASQNWEESIIRARALRVTFPPPHYPQAWHTLEIEYDFLYDTGQWDVLERLVDENWPSYKLYPEALPGGLGALNNLFATERLARLVDTVEPQAWKFLPPESRENLRLRAELARHNLALVARTGVRVVSLGQNCLPYLLGGRWGLLGPAAVERELQPFDLGGFHGENVAEVLETDFAAFHDRAKYIVTPAYGGGQMYTHQPSNVGFFHERGPWWMNDPTRFFGRIDMMLANWETVKAAPRRLFVFCFCGAGTLERLVKAMGDLLGPDSHLLIVDVLQHPHAKPAHPHVSYVHIPYPRDYTWTKVGDQLSARSGIAFELGVAGSIVEALSHWDVAQGAAAADRAKILREAAARCRSGGLDENAVALEASALIQLPPDAATAIGNARALQDMNRGLVADALLTRTAQRFPEDFSLQKNWAEMPIHDADWEETIIRGAALRAAFPAHPHAFLSLNAELAAFYDAGRWDEAAGFLHHNWAQFTSRPELFGNALDMSSKLFRHHGVRDLLDAATPTALQGFDAQAIASLIYITDRAFENQKRLRAANATVISLGHNAHPYILAGRWGLHAGPAKFGTLTPFDIGGFSNPAAIAAIASDFSAFHNHGDFIESRAWFGGQMLVHQPTGANFLSHRRARWTATDRGNFFAHFEAMIGNWRRLQAQAPRVYVINRSEQADLTALVQLFEANLGRETRLVIIDENSPAAVAPPIRGVSYIHAPPPDHYHWHRLTGVAHPIHIAYEEKLIRAITESMA